MCLDGGQWHSYRLPKASHSYDGAHGWNTEWPRIRDIGETDLLMTMHGMFWKFPRSFRAGNSAGIKPRSTYLKVVGDFCRWQDRIVLGCDDTAKSEFLNKRKAKGQIAAPQSQSNLWFVAPDKLDHFGPAMGRGAVWLKDDVASGSYSEPFLFNGFDRRALQLAHETKGTITVTLEIDEAGTQQWRKLMDVTLGEKSNEWIDLSDQPQAAWIRLSTGSDAKQLTAWFTFSNRDNREDSGESIFDGLAKIGEQRATGGIMRARGENKRTLHFVATEPSDDGPKKIGLYELNESLELRPVDDSAALEYQQTHASIAVGSITADAASLIYTDDAGRRWRLPRSPNYVDQQGPLGPARVCREVATERDLFNAGGTFFELPAENAGGFAKVRAVATHDRSVVDYCSYRGLFLMSGVSQSAPHDNSHIVRSTDGRTALWAGAIDDVWKLGKPRGIGGPWKSSSVKANQPSDPYLMTGYETKVLSLSHQEDSTVAFRIECDITGSGLWIPCYTCQVPAKQTLQHTFPTAWSAYWLRAIALSDCVATVQLEFR